MDQLLPTRRVQRDVLLRAPVHLAARGPVASPQTSSCQLLSPRAARKLKRVAGVAASIRVAGNERDALRAWPLLQTPVRLSCGDRNSEKDSFIRASWIPAARPTKRAIYRVV